MEQRNFLSLGSARGTGLTRERIIRALAAGRRNTGRSDMATSYLLGDPAAILPVGQVERTLVPAAVLVLLVAQPGGFTILLTQRTSHLANHGGQISFPGGRMEATDADPVAAALRETEEEIGIRPDEVEVLGRLDDYITVTGFQVVPIVGMIRPPLTLVPDPFEVAEIFEVPLAFILDQANHQKHSRVTATGERRFYYAMPFEDRYIWGATAGMLVNLYEALSDPCAS